MEGRPLIAGSAMIGHGTTDGDLANLRAELAIDAVLLSWRHRGVTDPGHVLAVALDGELMQVLPAGSTAAVLPLPGDGAHRVDVVPVRGEARRIPDLHGAWYGRRAHVVWPPSEAADVAAYRVYVDDELAATVDTIAVERLITAQPSDGSGIGRISILGEWAGEVPINRVVTIAVVSGGRFVHDLDGDWSDAQPIVAGGTTLIGEGITVRWDSPLVDYLAEDEWDVRIGPPTRWTSEPLAEGTFEVRVAAVDRAGNESTGTDAGAVRIIHRPDGVTGLAAEWDGDDLTITWALPSGTLEEVLLYSNYDLTFGRLGEDLIDAAPHATLDDDATEHVIEDAAPGTWRIAVRVRAANGRLSDSVETIEIDTSGPPSDVRLTAPEGLAGVPAPDGQVVLSWRYNWAEGEHARVVQVFEGADEAAVEAALAVGTPYATIAVEEGGGVETMTWASDESGGWAQYGATRAFALRAASELSVYVGEASDIVVVPVDDEAPAHAGAAQGVPN